jgi:hypothetical protein
MQVKEQKLLRMGRPCNPRKEQSNSALGSSGLRQSALASGREKRLCVLLISQRYEKWRIPKRYFPHGGRHNNLVSILGVDISVRDRSSLQTLACLLYPIWVDGPTRKFRVHCQKGVCGVMLVESRASTFQTIFVSARQILDLKRPRSRLADPS